MKLYQKLLYRLLDALNADSQSDVFIHTASLITDQWYYISVDSVTAGTFTIYLDNHDIGSAQNLDGAIRFNTDTSKFENYNGTSWVNLH